MTTMNKKNVNVTTRLPIVQVFGAGVAGTIRNITLSSGDIRACLANGAKVEEIGPSGKLLPLNFSNYNSVNFEVNITEEEKKEIENPIKQVAEPIPVTEVPVENANVEVPVETEVPVDATVEVPVPVNAEAPVEVADVDNSVETAAVEVPVITEVSVDATVEVADVDNSVETAAVEVPVENVNKVIPASKDSRGYTNDRKNNRR